MIVVLPIPLNLTIKNRKKNNFSLISFFSRIDYRKKIEIKLADLYLALKSKVFLKRTKIIDLTPKKTISDFVLVSEKTPSDTSKLIISYFLPFKISKSNGEISISLNSHHLYDHMINHIFRTCASNENTMFLGLIRDNFDYEDQQKIKEIAKSKFKSIPIFIPKSKRKNLDSTILIELLLNNKQTAGDLAKTWEEKHTIWTELEDINEVFTQNIIGLK